MPEPRHVQRDLFEVSPIPKLRPELRTKVTPLLQALLVEAAAGQRQGNDPDLRLEEDGDDEDHA